MADYTVIRNAIKAKLDTITDIGTTHNRVRWSANWTDLLAKHKVTVGSVPQLRSWYITREAIAPTEVYSFGNVARMDQFVVRGLMTLDDSEDTETTFQELVDTVIDNLDTIKDAGAASVIDYGIGPCVVRVIEHREYGGVLCHFAEIVVPAHREKAITYA